MIISDGTCTAPSSRPLPVLVGVDLLEGKLRYVRVLYGDALGRLRDLVVDDQTVATYAQVFEVLLFRLDERLALQCNCSVDGGA